MKILIILGSTRQQRMGEHVFSWIKQEVASRTDASFTFADLREWSLPYFDEAAPPMALGGAYQVPRAKEWVELVGAHDGYIWVTPEYNHSFPAVLKNALDYPYYEWNKKPVSFVSYSGSPFGGVRAVEQLRQVAVELQMAPLRNAVHMQNIFSVFSQDGSIQDASHGRHLQTLLDELLWWTKALSAARQAQP